MHISDKLKTHSRWFWSTEAFWQISRFPIDRNAERCIHGAQDIIILTKEGVLTNPTALSPNRCISSINQKTTVTHYGQQRPADKSHSFQSTEMQIVVWMKRRHYYCNKVRRSDKSRVSQSYELNMVDKVKNYSWLFWSTEACWLISRFPINLNVDHSIHIAHDIIVTNKRGRSDKSHGSKSYQMHISDKLKTHSRWFWSTEAFWQISRFPNNRNVISMARNTLL